MRRVGHIVNTADIKECIKILVGKSDTKRLLRGPRLRCEDNIKICLEEIQRNGAKSKNIQINKTA
jgi:hypothetical protein